MNLEEKLKELMSKREQALANYNAICGAIQFCQSLINEQNEKEGDVNEH